MARFLAGLLLGAAIVGAGWWGNRVGYQQGKADLLEAQAVAATARATERESEPARRDDERWALDEPRSERVEASDCMLATIPPKPCSELADQPERSDAEPGYRQGVSRRARRKPVDDGGPWKTVPAPWITPAQRAELVAKGL